MIGRRRQRLYQFNLVEHSPLRQVDPRTKLLLSLGASLVVMLSLERLLIFIGVYALLLIWAHLLRPALQQVWRLKWILLVIFFLDWWLVDVLHAVTICVRLALLAGVFALFFSTTTTRELGQALERMGVPYRYAFSLSLAFESLGLMSAEWYLIQEAQLSRGAIAELSTIRRFLKQLGDLMALTVPAIVLTTRRAWSITEAAYARGFDSPHRRSYYSLAFKPIDWMLMSGMTLVLVLMFWL